MPTTEILWAPDSLKGTAPETIGIHRVASLCTSVSYRSTSGSCPARKNLRGTTPLLYLLGSHWHAHTSGGFGDYLDNYITNDLPDEVADYEHALRMIGALATADLLSTAADAYRRDDWAALEAMPSYGEEEDVPSLAQCYLERHKGEL